MKNDDAALMEPQKVFARAEGSRVIPDHDLLRAAQLLVKRHGADAAIVAAQRVDELAREGDFEGAAVWRSTSSASRLDLRGMVFAFGSPHA